MQIRLRLDLATARVATARGNRSTKLLHVEPGYYMDMVTEYNVAIRKSSDGVMTYQYRYLASLYDTRNVLDCDQSNYSARIIFSYTFT